MVFLNPASVTLLGKTLDGVTLVLVDRRATKLALERGDLGPHCVFADAPEQRVVVRVERAVSADEAAPAKPGEQGALAFRTGVGSDNAGVRSYSATVVVMAVEHEIRRRGGARQVIEMVALSATGADDPIAESGVAL